MIWLLLALLAVGVIMTLQQASVSDDKVERIAKAIARAEGYYVPGSLPNRLNNPGSLKDPVTGKLRSFATPEDGWNALKQQIRRMLAGTSLYYRPDYSLLQVAQIYTGGDKPYEWATIVARELGVTVDTPLQAV